jgi:hypothetical protein
MFSTPFSPAVFCLQVFSTPAMRLAALSVVSISPSVDHLQSHFHLTHAEVNDTIPQEDDLEYE